MVVRSARSRYVGRAWPDEEPVPSQCAKTEMHKPQHCLDGVTREHSDTSRCDSLASSHGRTELTTDTSTEFSVHTMADFSIARVAV